jgi:hypothetical protein
LPLILREKHKETWLMKQKKRIVFMRELHLRYSCRTRGNFERALRASLNSSTLNTTGKQKRLKVPVFFSFVTLVATIHQLQVPSNGKVQGQQQRNEDANHAVVNDDAICASSDLSP